MEESPERWGVGVMDTHKKAFGKRSGIIVADEIIDGRGFSEALKFSQCQSVVVNDCEIDGGAEDCIDIVRGFSYHLVAIDLHPRGKFGITIKGGVNYVTMVGLIFHSHSSECDIDLGNWTNYDIVKRPKVRNIVIRDCKSTTGKPIKVMVLHSDIPSIINSNVELKVIHPFFVWCFFTMRRFGWFGGKVEVDPEELKLQPWEL
jgi:hypothetical protein